MEILNHIALPVSFSTDVEDFYTGVLGFTEEYRFDVDEETALAVFGISRNINVVVVEKWGLKLELYQTGGGCVPVFSHVCLNEENVDLVCRRAEAADYKVVRISRPSAVLAFISDKSGNRFEIKQKIPASYIVNKK